MLIEEIKGNKYEKHERPLVQIEGNIEMSPREIRY
jgi:hypothetical protein